MAKFSAERQVVNFSIIINDSYRAKNSSEPVRIVTYIETPQANSAPDGKELISNKVTNKEREQSFSLKPVYAGFFCRLRHSKVLSAFL